MITKDNLIGDVISRYPEAIDLMMGYGMHCIGCSLSMHETIEAGALMHGFSKKQIKKMLEEINVEVNKKKK